jgi:uncharacterized membrane protein HdeD (DUF308 family)
MRELNPVSKLTGLDYFQLINSFIFVGLGGIILFRTLKAGMFWLPIIFALAFIGFGIYRLRFFFRYFKERGKKA